MSLPSPSDDLMPFLIQEYNDMDPQLRSDFLDQWDTTRAGWAAQVAAYHRRRRAARTQRLQEAAEGTAAGREGSVVSPGAMVVAIRLSMTAECVEVRLGDGRSNGDIGSRRYSSAPPSRGFGASGPGRRSSGGRRRLGFRGRPDMPLVSVVIMLPEK